ncbi:cytochrome c oxidase assembly protein [Actinoplanes sp. NPDC049316]|uniref:cytochrome c oxidase assembly protein n=1 Tax=Actinoplanes sp. NPDC049316 TaxID=3154727 RepID=UPI00342D06F5
MPGLFGVALLTAAVLYVAAAGTVRRRGRWWPPGCTTLWLGGLATAAVALTGPLAREAHHDFTAHMAGHLLLGMTAPLLLVLAAPVTLALRALPARQARGLSRILRSLPVRVLTHPVTAGVLNAGGLWVLYTTGVYREMGQHPWLHVLVHVHVAATGYLFTAAIIGVDPAPHRPGPRTRAAVLIAFLAAHAILAKHLYAHPPAGVPAAGGRTGAELMYYGGDLADVALIVVFCLQWYRSTDPRRRSAAGPRIPAHRLPGRPWRLPEEARTGAE